MRRIVSRLAVAIVFLGWFGCNGSGGGSPTGPSMPNGLLRIVFDVEISAGSIFEFRSWTAKLDSGNLNAPRCSAILGCNPYLMNAVARSVRGGSHLFELRLEDASYDLIPLASGSRVTCRITGLFRIYSEDSEALLQTVSLPDRTVNLARGESTTFAIEVNP